MRISDVLRHKGSDVATVAPTALVSDLVAALAEHNVGALVVVDNDAVVGIVSERDVVRQLDQHGGDLLNSPIAEIMTADVVTCAATDTVDALAATMTERRIRHMPVVAEGRLVGIVSIGDVVKHKISALQFERDQLDHYVHQT